MISAFKRLVAPNSNEAKDKENTINGANNTIVSNKNNAANNSIATLPASFLNNGMQMISQSLQKKFSKGVNYNMKIVIRGDCNVGKTTLWLRLQGQPFKEAYETSEEIKVSNIQWNYKTTDDIVKVEVWDVVDRSKKKRNLLNQPRNVSNSASLKLDNENSSASKSGQPVEASLDAEFIDVYKNASGVILVYDITKQWTWDYIERELPKIPTHIPVLIIGNHRDMNHHRCIDELKCKYFIENLNRGSLGSAVRYTETSMRTGFGLKYIYKFFNIPYLQLQRETLMQHLETNAKEMDAICEELQEIEENIDNDYDDFSKSLNTTRRQQQEENAKDILKNAKTIDEARKLAAEKEAANALATQMEAQTDPKKALNQFINKLNTKVTQIAQVPLPAPVSMSITVDPNDKKNKSLTNLTNSISHNSLLNKNQAKNNSSLSELPHDEELDRFLDDPFKSNKISSNAVPTETKIASHNKFNNVDDDEDEIGNNPMVAVVKETIDSSDESDFKVKSNKESNVKPISIQQIDLSDEEETKKLQNKSKTYNASKHQNKSSNGEFVFVNNKSTNSSTCSNGSNETSNIYVQNNDPQITQTKLETFSATSSIINLEISNNNVPKSDDASNTDQTQQQFQLTNDDFDFLEKMTTTDKEAKKSSKVKKPSSDKKVKSSKSSSKISEDSQSFNDDSSVNSASKKTHKAKDSSEIKEKKEKKKSKSSSKKSSRKQQEDEYEEDDDTQNHISVKKDEDYEEL